MSAWGLFGLPGRRGWLPFRWRPHRCRRALLVTCAFLVGYGLYAGRQNIQLLKRGRDERAGGLAPP